MERIDEIRERAEKATAGPWYVPLYGYSIDTAKVKLFHAFGAGEQVNADMRFVAASREDIPYLLDEIARLRAENAKLHAEIADREKNSIDEHGNMHYWRDRAREAEKETEEREHEIIQLRAELDDPRTVRLPCAVGDTVYKVSYDCARGCRYNPFNENGHSTAEICLKCGTYPCDLHRAVIPDTAQSEDWIWKNRGEFGKTMFLSPELAAEKVKEADPHD